MARRPKNVVYLWGAGATHAEAQRLGSALSLLMRDDPVLGEGITSRILARTGKRAVSAYGAGEGVDIEKLISLLAASGKDEHASLAEKMRTHYFTELKSSLSATTLLTAPELSIRLLKLHSDPAFRKVERLCGIVTTNHDGLLQVASQEVFGAVNTGFDFVSDDFNQSAEPNLPPILQLHGSFTWRFGLPMRIEKLNRASAYAGTVWIPPTILKESKSYPYNKLAGFAYELLARQCDVLRVVGTSLTQNDWNILSLIFNAQRHRGATNGEPFVIELIMPRSSGEGIQKDCAYLKNMLSIGFLTDGRFAEYKEGTITPESDLANPFAYWLDEKIEFHRLRDDLTLARRSMVAPMAEAAP